MAIEDDVLVIGGGLAGMTAALAAAAAGSSVRVVSKAESSLGHASGLLDVLGRIDGELVSDPYRAIARVDTDHPYAMLGTDRVRQAMDWFDGILGDAYTGDSHTNALVPTIAGTVTPTARYPRTMAAGLASDDRSTLLVDIDRMPAVDAPLAAARLEAAGVPFSVRGASITMPGLATDITRSHFARLVDRNETIADEPIRDQLAAAIASVHDGEARIGFPAVLGLEQPAVVIDYLSAALDADVFELPTDPPSVPGERLTRLLEAALDDAGVRMTAGVPIVDVNAADGRVRDVRGTHANTSVPYRADQYILATGGLVGGGVVADRSTVHEPLFGCHVSQPADRADWYADTPAGPHAFPRFGVHTDHEMRPLEADGMPTFVNLRAAGAVIGGADFPAQHAGSGISIATGWHAGRRAAEAIDR